MDTTKTDDVTADETAPAEDLLVTLDADDDDTDEHTPDELDSRPPSGVAAAAASVTAAGLGVIALSGSWVSRVFSERQTLIGQIESATANSSAEKISALYGDAWHATALVNGGFAVLALLTGLFVLARPAFGTPGRTLPLWVRAASWAAVVLGAFGVLLSVLMYTDILAPLPTAP
ncbi:hypothetical protein ACWCQL_27805 [Streptomyces sp. NPDC002073]